jgi:hypothetical protein
MCRTVPNLKGGHAQHRWSGVYRLYEQCRNTVSYWVCLLHLQHCKRQEASAVTVLGVFQHCLRHRRVTCCCYCAHL